MVHAFGELITLVNQTYGHVKENRDLVASLEIYAARLQVAYRNASQRLTERERYITNLGRQLAVGQLLDSLEALHLAWRREMDMWQTQRRALESGWLTEAILPRGELERVLDAGRSQGFQTPPAHWYFEHVRIHAVW